MRSSCSTNLEIRTTVLLDYCTLLALYSQPPGCGADGSAPRLGRGGRRFKSAHPDLFTRWDETSFRSDVFLIQAHFALLAPILPPSL